MSEDNGFMLAPFIANQFGIIATGKDELNHVLVDYVYDISDDDIAKIQNLSRMAIKPNKHITIEEFALGFEQLYDSKPSLAGLRKILENSVEHLPTFDEQFQAKNNQPKNDYIRPELNMFSDEELAKELRFRSLKRPASGTLKISPKGELSVDFKEMPWPVGEFEIEVKCTKDKTTIKEDISNG